jgi:hypothetical protein
MPNCLPDVHYQKISMYLDPVSKEIPAVIWVGYLFRLMTHRPEKT